MSEIELAQVTQVIERVGALAGLDADADFYDAGFSSINALMLLMELEERFAVQIPDDRFVNARTPRSLYELLASLRNG